MKQLTGNQVRQMFLDYFKSKGHMIEPGASLIPHNDPTLLWINAGVAALKKYFDGSEKPACNRIANAQKSIRTNDIENVGKTARHHTFFEMLGNFSIGDYFKEEAIPFAWEFLTSPEWIGFDKEKLYVTVYTDDEDAYRIWTEVCHVDPSHILKTYENFWEIGEGPGGPDSEIFYDRGEKYDPEGLGEKLFFEEMENDRYIEVWNVVFSQYDCNPAIDRKEYKELPQKNIDTGMGLERLVSIIQGGETNFDTDLFLPIIHATEKLANVSYEENKMAYRVIADHIRTVTFALADGAMFDNAGRGYVLRRILRRAVRYGKQIGIEKAFMYDLVPLVCDMMKDFYDYLPEKQDFISTMVKKEEEAFHKTLLNGEKLLKSLIDKNENGGISGKDAFKLYDTYGFPFELTLEIAEESNLTVNEEEFKEELKIQQERSRASRDNNESMASQKPDLMAFVEPSTFVYDPTPIQGKVIGLFKDGVKTDEITDKGEVIFDTTPFYAEMGGQCGDTGSLDNETTHANVVNTLNAPNKQHMHFVEVKEGAIHLGDTFTLSIDQQKRRQITANHSATHILQKALQETLGDHISQAGSYVDDKVLRFDFTHFEKISAELLKEIEEKIIQYDGLAKLKDAKVVSGEQRINREDLSDEFKNVVSLEATNNTKRNILFSSGVFTIKEGKNIEENDKNSIIVHEEFAKQNNLKLGDEVDLELLDVEKSGKIKSHKFKIIGSFSGKKQETYTGLSSDFSENMVFVDYSTSQEILNKSENNKIANKILMYSGSAESTDLALNKLKELKIDESKYFVEKDSKAFEESLESVSGIKHIIKIMTYSIMLGGMVVLSLILILWLRERIYEIGIFLSIGTSKIQIIMQFIFELIFISIPSIISSLFLGNVLLKVIVDGFINSEDSMISGGSLINNSSFMLNITTLGQSYLILISIIVLSVVFASSLILIKKPKEILSKIS